MKAESVDTRILKWGAVGSLLLLIAAFITAAAPPVAAERDHQEVLVVSVS